MLSAGTCRYAGANIPEAPVEGTPKIADYVLPEDCNELVGVGLKALLHGNRPTRYHYHLRDDWETAFWSHLDVETALALTVAALVALVNATFPGKVYTYDEMNAPYRIKNSFEGKQAAT